MGTIYETVTKPNDFTAVYEHVYSAKVPARTPGSLETIVLRVRVTSADYTRDGRRGFCDTEAGASMWSPTNGWLEVFRIDGPDAKASFEELLPSKLPTEPADFNDVAMIISARAEEITFAPYLT